MTEDDDNEIPVDIPDEIERKAQNILDGMDIETNESPSGHETDFLSGFGSQQFLGRGSDEETFSFSDLLGEDKMSREEKTIHILQNEPQYFAKVFGVGVVVNLLVLHGGRKAGISDYTLGTIGTHLNQKLTDWMIDRYEP